MIRRDSQVLVQTQKIYGVAVILPQCLEYSCQIRTQIVKCLCLRTWETEQIDRVKIGPFEPMLTKSDVQPYDSFDESISTFDLSDNKTTK